MPSTVFISYSHQDRRWKNLLVRQLGVLESEGLLATWHDGLIQLGADWLAKSGSSGRPRIAPALERLGGDGPCPFLPSHGEDLLRGEGQQGDLGAGRRRRRRGRSPLRRDGTRLRAAQVLDVGARQGVLSTSERPSVSARPPSLDGPRHSPGSFTVAEVSGLSSSRSWRSVALAAGKSSSATSDGCCLRRSAASPAIGLAVSAGVGHPHPAPGAGAPRSAPLERGFGAAQPPGETGAGGAALTNVGFPG
jgi:hypothetical protein